MTESRYIDPEDEAFNEIERQAKQRKEAEMPPYLNAYYEGDDLFTGEQLRAAVLAEREACAKVVDDWSDWHGGTELIAAVIRERGQA